MTISYQTFPLKIRVPMLQERVSDDIHVFTSERYAQVTASLVVTPAGGILVDTLPFPDETREIAEFAARRCPGGIRYVVLTHYHADHTYGAYLFPQAEVVAHRLCRERLITLGVPALAKAKEETPELAEVELRFPDLVFDEGELYLHLGGKTLRLFATPGHTMDSIAVHVMEENILLAADAMMPVPTIMDGDLEAMLQSLRTLQQQRFESIVQGHGEVLLRGEIPIRLEANIRYLETIRDLVQEALAEGRPRESLRSTSIEDCGLSRIPLNGLVQQLHVANLMALYERMAQPQRV
ncbi:MAG: MBL fold metallo-hydrolase [Chloroflexi bacterium]|nr:MAG: MBL fold metallo-hydrolase [Chloroflexota bacterium]